MPATRNRPSHAKHEALNPQTWLTVTMVIPRHFCSVKAVDPLLPVCADVGYFRRPDVLLQYTAVSGDLLDPAASVQTSAARVQGSGRRHCRPYVRQLQRRPRIMSSRDAIDRAAIIPGNHASEPSCCPLNQIDVSAMHFRSRDALISETFCPAF